MSTFGGTMVEYPQIAIDMFQGEEVLRARGYFLSHCHAGNSLSDSDSVPLIVFYAASSAQKEQLFAIAHSNATPTARHAHEQ